MALTVWPPLDSEPWPTLGHGVIDFIEATWVHGPGARAGRPVQLNRESKLLICKHYEVYPRGHEQAGWRRFRYCEDVETKGTAKTETAVLEAATELHPDGPVRFDGWRKVEGAWVPVGRPITNPQIAMLANTEEQTDELGYGVLKYVIENSPHLTNLFDVSLERVLRLDPYGRAAGMAKSYAVSPDALDGKLLTHIHADETHRWKTTRMKDGFSTLLEGLTKRTADEPWIHATSTMYTPGELSLLELDHEKVDEYVRDGDGDRAMFFFLRWAPKRDGEDLEDKAQRRAAIREAKGPLIAASFDHFDRHVEDLVSSYEQAQRLGKLGYWKRVQLNRPDTDELHPFSVERWKELDRALPLPKRRTAISLGLDGSRYRDVTMLVATEILTGWQWCAGFWIPAEEPGDEQNPAGEVPITQVHAIADELAKEYFIVRAYGDPAAGFRELLAKWSGSEWGRGRVAEFWTDSRGLRRTAEMLKGYQQAMRNGDVTHQVGDDDGRRGDKVLAEHIGNAIKNPISLKDEDGEPLWLIRKEHEHSPKKIDGAMAGGISWQARVDAIASGKPLADDQPVDDYSGSRTAYTFQ